jgi:hypothetical protein
MQKRLQNSKVDIVFKFAFSSFSICYFFVLLLGALWGYGPTVPPRGHTIGTLSNDSPKAAVVLRATLQIELDECVILHATAECLTQFRTAELP